MTADAMLAECRRVSPSIRWAKTTTGEWIGAFDEKLSRFVAIYGITIMGVWAGPMAHELCVDGKPLSAGYVWLE